MALWSGILQCEEFGEAAKRRKGFSLLYRVVGLCMVSQSGSLAHCPAELLRIM